MPYCNQCQSRFDNDEINIDIFVHRGEEFPQGGFDEKIPVCPECGSDNIDWDALDNEECDYSDSDNEKYVVENIYDNKDDEILD